MLTPGAGVIKFLYTYTYTCMQTLAIRMRYICTHARYCYWWAGPFYNSWSLTMHQLGRAPPDDTEHELLALPPRLGGLGLVNPISLGNSEYPAGVCNWRYGATCSSSLTVEASRHIFPALMSSLGRAQ